MTDQIDSAEKWLALPKAKIRSKPQAECPECGHCADMPVEYGTKICESCDTQFRYDNDP